MMPSNKQQPVAGRAARRWPALVCALLVLPLIGGWAAPSEPPLEIAAAQADEVLSGAPPERITADSLARWPRLLREDWSDGLKIAGRDPGGRWSRTMSNDVKWHKENGEKQVFTYPGQNGQTFDPFSIVQHSGKRWLRISARATPANEIKAAWGQPIQSGVLSNFRTMGFTYGYMEARVILPDVNGAWPAFWTLANDNKWPPEIDVFEHLNPADRREGGIDKVHVNTHWWSKAARGHAGRGGYVTLPDGGKVTEPHLYGALWTKDFIAHYIDRRLVKVVPNPRTEPGVVEGLHKPMHLIFTLAMGGRWPGPVAMDKLPTHMDITDIAVWGLPERR